MAKYWGDPDFSQMAVAAVVAVLLGYSLSWAMDKAFLRRLVRDRIACIAYGCILVYLLLMGGSTLLLTWTSPFDGGPVIIPSIGYAISFLLGVAIAGALRMAVYARYEGNLDEEIVFDPNYADLSLYDHEVLAWDETNAGRNYLRRHWVGHLSLPVSYWVNGVLVPALILAAAELIAYEAKASWQSLRAIAIVALLYLIVSLIVSVWSSVGIWRSAYWHRRRGGSPGWGFAARTLVVLWAVLALFRSGDFALQAAEWGGLATGRDSLGAVATMKVSPDGRELAVRGTLSEGAADRFEALLRASPNVTDVALTSRGGRMFEAERMAAAVRKRGLDTRVDDLCMSACTSVLLAGRERSAGENARIGFHQPSFPGLSAGELRGAIEETRQQYLAAGVDADFVWRAISTPASDIWVPTQEELLAANVLTASEIVADRKPGKGRANRDDGVPPALAALHAQMEAAAGRSNLDAPKRLDAVTTFDRATVSGVTLTNFYTLRIPGLNAAATKPRVAAGLRRDICRDPSAADAISQGGRFVQVYRNGAGKPLFEVAVTDCPVG